MFLHVVSVNYLKDYKLQLTFNNQETLTVNLAEELHGEIFEPLQNPEFFKQAAVNPETNTIEWPNGADFAPEFLYDLGEAAQKTA
jgi:hypothetical protein